jgi:hypothetical protein
MQKPFHPEMKVSCGCLGCLTDDCEHFGEACKVLERTPCLLQIEVSPSSPSKEPA